MTFSLHPKLLEDTAFVADWPLSRVLLLNDRRYPWIVLVPRQPALAELLDLPESARLVLMGEIGRAAAGLRRWAQAHGGCDRVNVGMIGNIVPQLHVHIVARRKDDAAWPGVVWGSGQSLPYDPAGRDARIEQFRDFL